MKAQRIALDVEYKGTHYHGWQRQGHRPTIQRALEHALSMIANHPVQLTCAGRTDAGVHAVGQVVHFDTYAPRRLDQWVRGTNTYLPKDICVRWARRVDPTFNARFSALARRYLYKIDNRKQSPAVFDQLVAWCAHPLDENKMHLAGQAWIGEHDFSSFRGRHCQSLSTLRDVHWVRVKREGSMIYIDIQANAFLHHMVRNMVGVLMLIGRGKNPPLWAKEVLDQRDRSAASITAPACGLYLLEVTYPEATLAGIEDREECSEAHHP